MPDFFSQTADPDHLLVNTLCKCNSFIDYIETVLMDERRSLNNDHIYQFFRNFFPKVRIIITLSVPIDFIADRVDSSRTKTSMCFDDDEAFAVLHVIMSSQIFLSCNQNIFYSCIYYLY